MNQFDIIGQAAPNPESVGCSTGEAELYQQVEDTKLQEVIDAGKEQEMEFREKIRHFRSMNSLRKWAAIAIFSLITIWLICVFGLVFFGSYEVYYLSGACGSYELQDWHQKLKAIPEGCNYLKRGNFLNLSEGIVVTLIGSTTANVLGLSYIVANWLFPKTPVTI
ncbi:hypothetical protein VP758_001581 [Vibrio harveyi]|nr:hypothetical protein [Vibrio harveyi]